MVSTTPVDDVDVPFEKDDMQGILVSAFAHLPCVAYSLLRVVDRVAARRWLLDISCLVTNAVAKQEGWSLNIERGRGVLNELSGLINTGPDPHKKPKVRPSVW